MTDYRDRRTRAVAVAGRLYDRRTSSPTAAAAEDRLGIAAFAETADMQLRQERDRCGIEVWAVDDVKERSAGEAAARDSDCSERDTQSPGVHAAYDPYCMGLAGP
jgi:hypothetical protein